jgi:hypothetical protein
MNTTRVAVEVSVLDSVELPHSQVAPPSLGGVGDTLVMNYILVWGGDDDIVVDNGDDHIVVDAEINEN